MRVRDVSAVIARWIERGIAFAVATVVGVRNAAPAPLGAMMAVSHEGAIVGDIGAGCYEGEIVEAAMETSRDGDSRVLTIDLTSDDPTTGVNGCGGSLDIVVWRPGAAFRVLAEAAARGRDEVTFPISYPRDGRPIEFTARYAARRTLVIVGATSLAQEIAYLAVRLDFRTIVVDPRPAFATKERLSAVDEIVVAWPDEALPPLLSSATPLIVVSHDPKIDLPALCAGLSSESPYVGLLGSRRAQAGRRSALRAMGFEDAALARIHGPAGLDLGGVTGAETAVSIVAEIVAAERGRSGGALVAHRGAIHNVTAGSR